MSVMFQQVSSFNEFIFIQSLFSVPFLCHHPVKYRQHVGESLSRTRLRPDQRVPFCHNLWNGFWLDERWRTVAKDRLHIAH